MVDLLDTGLEIDTLAEIQDQLEGSIRSEVPGGHALNLSSTAVIGQYVGITASTLSELQDALQAVWLSWAVDSATGAALDRLVALNGVTRLPAAPSTVTMTLDLDAGTYAAGTLVVHLVTNPGIRFSNRDELILGADNPSYSAVFESEEDGPVEAGAGQLTVITTPVTGFNAATNALDAEPGRFAETDAALRNRRRSLLALRGIGSVDAIRGAVASVDGVSFARVLENDTDFTVNGMPPHSFQTLVLGGDNTEIATAIYQEKPAGIQAFGTTIINIADSQGSGHDIGFTRPTDVNVYITVNLTYLGGLYVGSDDIKQLLADWGDENLGPGNDVLHARLVQQVMAASGVVDATVTLGTAPSPVSSANVVIAPTEIARLDTSRIVVNSTGVVGAP